MGPTGLFLGLGKGSKTFLMSTNVAELFLFSIFPAFLTFDFDLILGSILTFWVPNGLCLGWGRIQKLLWGLLISTNNFCFLSLALFLLSLVVLSSWWVVGGGGGGWWWWWFPAIT